MENSAITDADMPLEDFKSIVVDPNRAAKLLLISVSIFLLLAFSKFGYTPPLKSTTPSQPVTSYISNPGGNYLKINVRSGPGVNFSVIREMDRGGVVIGIGHALDKNGNRWIQLQDGGYAKETILTKTGPQK